MITASASATDELRAGIDLYLKSIDSGDLDLAERIWVTGPDSSFIHPRGHERGWDEIARNFYGDTMGATFSQRDLRLAGEVTLQVYGDAAVVEFDWAFDAVFRDNGQPLHTEGRESQVWVKTGEAWKLVHVHYSGPPVTGLREGF